MKTLAAAAALVFAALPLAAPAQTAIAVPVPQEATLTLGADGVVERAPDQATVSLQIVTNDDDATASASKNNAIYAALRTKLGPLNLGADAVRTTSYNVQFVPHPPKNLPPEQRQPRYGYVTSRSVAVITPVDAAGKAIDAATAAGATQSGDVAFDLKDRKGAYLAALGAAMADAKRQAAAVAAAGGFALVRMQTVNVGYESQPQPPRAFAMMKTADAIGAPAPPTDLGGGGPIQVTAHVTVTYAIR